MNTNNTEMLTQRNLKLIQSLDKLWEDKADILAALPEQDRNAVKAGILQEYLLTGIRKRADYRNLFIVAAYALSLSNNDPRFMSDVLAALPTE